MIKIKFLPLMCLVLLAFSYLPLSAMGREKVVVILKDKAEVKGDFIYLGEIAREVKADENLKRKLLKIKVGSSPLPGKTRFLNKAYVLVRLYQNGISPQQVSIYGNEEILVSRENLSLSDKQGKRDLSGKDSSLREKESYLVRRGDIVSLVVEEGNLRVVTQARALESGKKGETIEVINVSSFKKIKGKIIAPFTVKVNPIGVEEW
ncbi:flagellar basal body P-ring formation protein FlgA [Candidatus Aerophobetes bacterium]|nr:flagellar basal body P-ring formation protein FlgA [Candidatus Aerophobetes bacterium]